MFLFGKTEPPIQLQGVPPYLLPLPHSSSQCYPFFKLQVKTQCSLQIPFFPITPYVIFWKSCQFSFADNFQIYLLLSLSLPLPPQSKFPPSFTWTITFGLFSDGIFHNVILFSLYHLVKNLQWLPRAVRLEVPPDMSSSGLQVLAFQTYLVPFSSLCSFQFPEGVSSSLP